MKKYYILFLGFPLLPYLTGMQAFSQTNILCTNPVAEQILLGNFNPATYLPPQPIANANEIICGINQNVSADSLKAYLEHLTLFHNRNTGSDTISSTRGIGAARQWVFSKFTEFSNENQNRLVPSYLQFDQVICSMGRHKNIFAVLPGSDTANHGIVIIEGHIDSRCEGVCDTSCLAQGIDDNGSGTALVLELARVMSRFTFKNTLVFLVTIGEEQGLYGAEAFAAYADNLNLPIKAVQNNDIVGGIICGKTSSPPSCPGENDIDSTEIRLFSAGTTSQKNRGYARFVKLTYNEKLLPIVKVPMTVGIYNQEDRTGRGGDHIPFRMHNFTAMRFTSANEHGDANSSDSTYTDRQHSTGDILGVDTDSNGAIDSFYVDFNYLARNSVVNGVSAAVCAIGPEIPDLTLTNDTNGIHIQITGNTQYPQYRIGVHATTSPTDFDAIYRIQGTPLFTIPGIQKGKAYYMSVASVDSNGITSPFSKEYIAIASTTTPPGVPDSFPLVTSCLPAAIRSIENNIMPGGILLLPPAPNPCNQSVVFDLEMKQPCVFSTIALSITNMNGTVINTLKVDNRKSKTEVTMDISILSPGIYFCHLIADGSIMQSQKIVIIR